MSDQSVLIDGYCYELPAVYTRTGLDDDPAECRYAHWLMAGSEEWEVVVRTKIRATRELGQKRIDGTTCLIFECDDGRIRAVVMTAAVARRRPLELPYVR